MEMVSCKVMTTENKLTLCSTPLDHQMSLLGVHLHPQNVKPTGCMTVNVKLTLCSTALDHQMSLLGGMPDCLLHSQLHSSECQDDLM